MRFIGIFFPTLAHRDEAFHAENTKKDQASVSDVEENGLLKLIVYSLY